MGIWFSSGRKVPPPKPSNGLLWVWSGGWTLLGTWLSRLRRVERSELSTKRLVVNDSNC